MKEEDLERFEEQIGMRADPNEIAKEALAAYQEAAGQKFENPDAPVGPDAKAIALMTDKQLGSYMGDGRNSG